MHVNVDAVTHIELQAGNKTGVGVQAALGKMSRCGFPHTIKAIIESSADARYVAKTLMALTLLRKSPEAGQGSHVDEASWPFGQIAWLHCYTVRSVRLMDCLWSANERDSDQLDSL